MKVFITVELEKEDNLEQVMSKECYNKMFEAIEQMRKEGIPMQYKETNLPRYKPRFERASELK